MILSVFFSILSSISGQLGPNYDPIFYDVIIYIVGGILFSIIFIAVIIYIALKVSKKRKYKKYQESLDKSSDDFSEVIAKTYRGLCEFNIQGVSTNIPFLQSLLKHPDLVESKMYTRFVEDHIKDLVAKDDVSHRELYFAFKEPEVAEKQSKGKQL